MSTLRGRRVLILRPRAAGGLLAHCRDEHRVLSERGARTIDAGPAGQSITIPAADRVLLPLGASLQPVHDLQSLVRLRRALRQAPGVPVHAHGLRAGALAALARIGVRRRGRLITTLHNRTAPHGIAGIIGRVLLRIAAHGSDLILGVSPDLVAAAEHAGARRAERAVIPGARRPSIPAGRGVLPTPSRQEPAEGVSILVPARLAPQKDLPTLLAALTALPDDQRARLRVAIAGDGPGRHALQQQITEQSLPVTLLGHRTDLPQLMACADLVLQSSLWEGQPVALQEAIHQGCAIIATDAGGTRWVTGEAALLVPPSSPRALADAIIRALDPAVRAHLSAQSRARSMQLPDDSDLAEQLTHALWPSPTPSKETR